MGNNTTLEFVQRLKELIIDLDSKIFKSRAKVLISYSKRYENFGSCGFSPSGLFKLIGFPDNYIIFEKSKKLELIKDLEFMGICLAVHEVRHRFQYYNKGSIISFEFLKDKIYINEDALMYIYKENKRLYSSNSKLFNKEFDASAIETIVYFGYKFMNFNTGKVLDLIKCNERTIEAILLKT